MIPLHTVKRRTWETTYYDIGDGETCEIHFTHENGDHYVGLIDLSDFEWVHKLSLYPALSRGGYIMYCEKDRGHIRNKYLHKAILSDPVLQTDHINRNSFDNRRCNLRLVTCSENLRNGSMQKNNTLGRKGLAVKRRPDGTINDIRAIFTTDEGQKEISFNVNKYGFDEALRLANEVLDKYQKENNISYSNTTKYDIFGEREKVKLQRLSNRYRVKKLTQY